MKANKRCRDCSGPFAGEQWQQLCWKCWREQQDGKTRDAGYQRGFADGYNAAEQRFLAEPHHKPSPGLDRDLIGSLIRLAHPDVHPPERFELANATTARLLELRSVAG